MRRPWFEATPALAAHGHTANPIERTTPMADPVKYAFLVSCSRDAKPWVFDSLTKLAKHIEAKREGQGIELVTQPLHFRDFNHQVVGVYTLFEGARTGFLGYAHLAGEDKLAILKAALAAVGPTLAQARAA